MPFRSDNKRFDVSTRRLFAKQEEMAVALEQMEVLRDAADDARIRALVSETPLAQREWQDYERHLLVAERNLSNLREQIEELSEKSVKLGDDMINKELEIKRWTTN